MFISFEGIDGSGKSTQAEKLVSYFNSMGQKAILVREPGGVALSERVREMLLTNGPAAPNNPWTEALLFNAARAQLIHEVIKPALDKNVIVVADRFVHSTLAYQGVGRGLGKDFLVELHKHSCLDLWPELTILVDIPIITAEERRNKRKPADRIEKAGQGFMKKVKQAFNDLATESPQTIIVVDGTLDEETLFCLVKEQVTAKIDLDKPHLGL